jgi:hypothetical protein
LVRSDFSLPPLRTGGLRPAYPRIGRRRFRLDLPVSLLNKARAWTFQFPADLKVSASLPVLEFRGGNGSEFISGATEIRCEAELQRNANKAVPRLRQRLAQPTRIRMRKKTPLWKHFPNDASMPFGNISI